MKNILYKNLFDELIDRLDNFMIGNPGSEAVRRKKEAPVEIARAATRGMIELLRAIPHTGVPDLVQELTLEERNQSGNIKAYPFPFITVSEREDGGIVSFVVDGEEVSLEDSVPFAELIHYASSRLYKGSFAYTIDPAKRTFFTSCSKEVSAVVLRHPHSIYAPTSLMYAGALITLPTPVAADGTVTITDGIGGSVEAPVLAGDNETAKLLKIVDAINAAEQFAYDSLFNGTAAQLFHRYDVTPDQRLNPQVVGGGTGTYAVADSGTYELPIPMYYFNDLSELAWSALMNLSPATTQPQPRQREAES